MHTRVGAAQPRVAAGPHHADVVVARPGRQGDHPLQDRLRLRKEQEVDLSVRDARSSSPHRRHAATPAQGVVEQCPRRAQGGERLVVGVTNIPSPSKLGSLKVPELKRYLTDLGMEAKGTKKELVAALTRAHSAAQAMLSGAEVAPVGANNNAENVEDLKATIASLREELETERAALTDAAMEVTEKTSANEELVEELSNKSTLLTEAESTIASLCAALSKKESEGTQMSQWVVELEEREHQLQCELQELKNGNIRVLCRLRPNKTGGPVAEGVGPHVVGYVPLAHHAEHDQQQ